MSLSDLENPQPNYNLIREYLISNNPEARAIRELWSCNQSTYHEYRGYLQSLSPGDWYLPKTEQPKLEKRNETQDSIPQQQPPIAQDVPNEDHSTKRWTAADLVNIPATAKYAFEGLSSVIDASVGVAVTALAFAPISAEMLALANAAGDIWVAELQAGQPNKCTKLARLHRATVSALDWSFDGSQLLSVGRDGSLCVWGRRPDAPGAVTCLRTIKNARAAFSTGRFHPVNPSLAVVATSAGCVELYNCSTGMLQSRCSVFGTFERPLELTALDCSNHHVFVGDAGGALHLLLCQRHGNDLSKLTVAKSRVKLHIPQGKPPPPPPLPPPPSKQQQQWRGAAPESTGVAALDLESGWPASAVVRIQYFPFCRSTESAVLAATLHSGVLCLVRVHEAQHLMEVHLRRAGGSMALWSSASICPLSAIQDAPLFTFASYDSNVYIYDPATVGVTRPGTGGGGRPAEKPAPTPGLEAPGTVTVLRGHRAPAIATAWSFDESLLVSADVGGQVIVWKRTKLF